MKFKLKPAPMVRKAVGTIKTQTIVRKRMPNGDIKTLKNETEYGTLPEQAEFPANCPHVGGEFGFVMSRNYNSVTVRSWVQLPVPGFTRDLLVKTHNRAFEHATNRVKERVTKARQTLEEIRSD